MPFVHWIPPGVLRFPLILFLLACGVDPSWPNLAGLSLWQRALGYWRYSTDHLFFRRWGRIQGVFMDNGLQPWLLAPGYYAAHGLHPLLLRAVSRVNDSVYRKLYCLTVCISVNTEKMAGTPVHARGLSGCGVES